jgi:hypothetical protein
MIKLPFMDKLGAIGFVGERKALALLCLGFYATLFFMIGLSARTELPEWVALFTAMTLMYGMTFFAVGAEWFWGRWFAIGLGYWGMTMTIMACVTTRSFPTTMIVFGVMHGLISLCLGGDKMVALFDAKPEWRARWNLDEQGVIRVRKSVTRAASSLPALIMFALAPREGQAILGLTAFALALVGLGGVLARRTYGVFALAFSGCATAVMLLAGREPILLSSVYRPEVFGVGATALYPLLGALATGLLFAAALPFAKPVARYLRK